LLSRTVAGLRPAIAGSTSLVGAVGGVAVGARRLTQDAEPVRPAGLVARRRSLGLTQRALRSCWASHAKLGFHSRAQIAGWRAADN